MQIDNRERPELSTTATRGAPRVGVVTSVQGLEGAHVELIDLETEHHDQVVLRFGHRDGGVAPTDDVNVVWALIVDANHLARLVDRRRTR